MKWLTFLILVASLVACEKVTYYPDKNLNLQETQILAHRGGRNDTLPENSLEAAKHALSVADGIEVDIQVSKDRTIFLSHDFRFFDCNGKRQCFADATDLTIRYSAGCGNSFSPLEAVFRHMSDNIIRKPVSIDLKGWIPCDESGLNIEAIMRLEAELVINLARSYQLEDVLIFETNLPSVLTWVKKRSSSSKTYLTSLGNYEEALLLALKHGLDGISYKHLVGEELTAERVSLAHKKGIRLMVWNIPDSTQASHLTQMGVDYLQVDL